MTEAPLFSIVIPCFNYGHWLERAVNSVLAQEGDDWELLVIDDGSTDTTAQVAEALLDRHPGRLRFLSQPNRGVAATRNRGIDETRGRYLIFLDADDELAPTALDSYRQLLERSPEADLLAGTHQVVTPDGRTKPCPVGRLPADHRRRLKTYLFDGALHLAGSAAAFRRGALTRRRYPEQLPSTEDIPVFAYLLANGEIAVTQAAVATMHQHPDSLRHDTRRAAAATPALLDEVFRTDLMPGWTQAYRRRYQVRRWLSLFRSHYLAGERSAALDCFHCALRREPLATLGRWSYLRKYLKLRCGLPPESKR